MGGAASHGQVTQEEKLTWQSPAATVCFPAQSRGRGRRVPADQSDQSFFYHPTQLRLLHQLKNWRVKNQVELSHSESQRPGSQEEKRRRSAFSLLPYPRWSWKTWCPISSQLLVNSGKQKISRDAQRQIWASALPGAEVA